MLIRWEILALVLPALLAQAAFWWDLRVRIEALTERDRARERELDELKRRVRDVERA